MLQIFDRHQGCWRRDRQGLQGSVGDGLLCRFWQSGDRIFTAAAALFAFAILPKMTLGAGADRTLGTGQAGELQKSQFGR